MSRMKWPTVADARQVFALANSRNVDRVMEQYADGATFQVPENEAPLRGKPAIRAFLTANFAAFPDWTIEITKVFLSGDETVVVNSVHGTNTGPLTQSDGHSAAPTNRPFVQEQLTRVVFDENGRVESLRSYGNPFLFEAAAVAPA
jgi:ketosteroid isomerase-like protein